MIDLWPEEGLVHSCRPVMARNEPVRFVCTVVFLVLCAVIAAFGWAAAADDSEGRVTWVTLAFTLAAAAFAGSLARWYLLTWATRVSITTHRTVVQRGILSKLLNEVRHCDVRNVRLYQSFFNRIFDVGSIEISSSGQSDIEIGVSGLLSPATIKRLINENRRVDSPAYSRS